MHFPGEVLRQLAPLGVFRPSEGNDDRRENMSSGLSFIAVDGAKPEEVDDAIRVRKTRSAGFVVETAIADGFQLSEREDLIAEAIRLSESRYRARKWNNKLMLPNNVISQLELSNNEPRRALVVRKILDSSFEQIGEAEVVPAIVRTRQLTFGLLAHELSNNKCLRPLRELVEARNVRTVTETGEIPVQQSARFVGEAVVQLLMIDANLDFTQWSQDRGLTVVSRSFDSSARTHANYSSNLESHDGIIGGQSVAYAQFSSPLRRAGDLVNHLITGRFIATEQPFYSAEEVALIAARLSANIIDRTPDQNPIAG